MAWNEPGKDQDPWGGKSNNGDGPPDLDQIWQRLRARLSKKRGGGKNGGSGGGGGPQLNPALLLWLIPVIVVIWLLSGFYVIQPGEQGVLLRLGRYTETVAPGWHWYWPSPIGRVISVDTERVRSASTHGIVLTKDESLAEVEVSLQYRISDSMNYLFQLNDPDQTVEQVLKSAVREMVGTSKLNQVIQEGMQPEDLPEEGLENVDLKETETNEKKPQPLDTLSDKLLQEVKAQKAEYPDITARSRALLPINIKKILQNTLDQYGAGVQIVAVNVQYAQPPEAVQSAFEEAIEAREEKERKQNIARAYAREVLARAQGEKARILAEAKAYKSRKVASARGDVARFSKLEQQYVKYPEVTHTRLYLEAMSDVLQDTRLILADQAENGPLMWLPLSEMQNNARSREGQSKSSGSSNAPLPKHEDAQNSSAGADSSTQTNTSSQTNRRRSRGRN